MTHQYPTIWSQLKNYKLLNLINKNGGGGGNRTRVRKHSTQASTCVAWVFNFRLIFLTQAGSDQASLENFCSQRDKHPEKASLLNFHLIPVHRPTRLDVAALSGQCVLVVRVGVCVFSCFFARSQGPGTPLKLPYPRRIQFAPILEGIQCKNMS